MEERIKLALERFAQMREETEVPEPFGAYFRKTADFVCETYKGISEFAGMDGKARAGLNKSLYEELLPQNYRTSYLNPGYAVSKLGKGYGRELSFLCYSLRGIIPFLFEYFHDKSRAEDIAILLEVVLQVYSCFTAQGQDGALPSEKEVRDTLYWFVSDYADVTVPARVRDKVDPTIDFAKRIVCDSDLSDPAYLYSYGEYVTEDEIRTAKYLASLSDEEIQTLADIVTGGFERGFVLTGKDIKKKSTAGIIYRLGFERIVKSVIKNLEAAGIESIIYRSGVHLLDGSGRNGYFGAIPSRQCEYDHKEDLALFWDKALYERRMLCLEEGYREHAASAGKYAGPLVIETFGETPFAPEDSEDRPVFDKKQTALSAKYLSEAGALVNRFIPEEERSFTIIAFPQAGIGKDYEEIFALTSKLNALDYKKYQTIQQHIIDALDPGERVHITGRDGNETDLFVQLRKLDDIKTQTQFENCTADVNIPVGEVFTSPVLEGTEGVLHVKRVFLENLEYRDLRLVFKDGFVTDYSCANFEDEEKNRKYIRDNILSNHESLPMGEFAIGTNTTAYAMARRFDIFKYLPILIAEKTGPHFAVGDTCYSRAEDIRVYNPDGREIISKDNSCSLKRKTEPENAYFNCHMDVTIPYEELGSIEVIYPDGSTALIMKDGLFTLDGTLELNEPIKDLIG